MIYFVTDKFQMCGFTYVTNKLGAEHSVYSLYTRATDLGES